MSPLAKTVLADLIVNGPSTADEIAKRITENPNSVAMSLPWLRGDGWVTDGSEARRLESGVGFTHGPQEKRDGHVVWDFLWWKPPNTVVYHGLSVPRT